MRKGLHIYNYLYNIQRVQKNKSQKTPELRDFARLKNNCASAQLKEGKTLHKDSIFLYTLEVQEGGKNDEERKES